MKSHPTLPLRVGILGGGQLARMLALKGHELGLEIHILSASATDPAAQVVRHHHQGDASSATAVRAFLEAVDLATFESEFMDATMLAQLSRETKTPIRPQPALMEKIQDRWEQKKLLEKHDLPTAPFFSVRDLPDARHALSALGGRMVLKKRRFGYDGYGTFVVKDEHELESLRTTIDGDPFGFIAEAFIPFRRELALMVARSPADEVRVLPLVETHQQNSRCLWVKGPVKAAGEARLRKRLDAFMSAIRYEGILGVELFETRQGLLLVNELAPRVHNSAHYSLDALEEDQFTLHLKATLALPLSKIRQNSKGFAMLNLLGGHTRAPKWQLPPDVHLHWYGKNDNRQGRKMGHLNALAPSSSAALKRLLAIRAQFDV